MASTYRTRYGVDWPREMSDEFIGMTVGKKWRKFKEELGIEFKDPWIPLIDAAKSLVPEEYFKVPDWTEQHFHDWVMAPKGKGCITWGCGSCGKLTLKSEPVFFPDRVGTIGELRPGSVIMAATGNPVVVRGVYDQVDAPLYVVRFSDGAETVCGGDHLWEVRYWGRVSWEGPRKSRKGRYGWVTRVRRTEELAALSDGQLSRRCFSVPLVSPVNFAPKDVPLDPYVVGCLIGDGSFVSGPVTFTSHQDDVEVRDGMAPGLRKAGCSLVLIKSDRRGTQYKVTGPAASVLRGLGLYGHRSYDKFVPAEYKFNSTEVRMGILAGLFDTDGTVGKNGHASFSTTSKTLADDVVFLLESVGATVTVSEKSPTYRLHGERKTGRTAYELHVHGLRAETARSLFRLGRKRDRITKDPVGFGRRRIVSVTPVADRGAYPRDTRCITIEERDVKGLPTRGLFPVGRFVVTHNSNDYGLLMLLDWATDPFDTAIRLGSTTKEALKSRSWEAVLRYFAVLKKNKRFVFPGRVSKSGYAILNEDNDDTPEAIGEKAGIIGVAVNDSEDSGKLQGAHAKYVRLVIDELATINHHDTILKAMTNLRIGADFKFFGLANPESWENDSCQYCIPEGGPSAVDVDTGFWISTRGYFVRHHDGLKSPTLASPEAREKYPYLITKDDIDENLKECDGNEDSPRFWQMVRGFPPPIGVGIPTVLDASTAADQKVDQPPPSSVVIGCAAGIDPAWSEGGDGACYSLCKVRQPVGGGYPILDFSELYRYQIKSSTGVPVMLQLREQTRQIMTRPGAYTAPLAATAVDSSGNQALADELDIFIGQGVTRCVHVNNSERASDRPIRANSDVPGNKKYKDRVTEAWCTLALFCKAGMVRGLPKAALSALVKRRFMTSKNSTVPRYPLALEPKDEFKARVFKRSPDEADAAANAALAVKEVLGILPYGWVPTAQAELVEQPANAPVVAVLPPSFVPCESGEATALDVMD